MEVRSNVVAVQHLPYPLRTKEAAKYVGLSASSLNKMRLTGTGPGFHRLGRAIVYLPSDLDSWMAARRTTSTTDGDARLPKRLSDLLPQARAA